MEIVSIGCQGLTTSQLGLGCMGMSDFYIRSTEAESATTIHSAVAEGVTMFDTADMYGPFTNERLVGACLKPHRGSVVIATKFGTVRLPDGTRGINGRPDYVRKACEASLHRLNTEYIDLYYLHRVDRAVPIEDTIGAMALLVQEGKVRFIGLSEVSPLTLRRAHAIFPISAVQSEYSLVSRDPEFDLFDTLQELAIGFVAYAPLGRGLLTGRFVRLQDIPQQDYRHTTPRFSADNFKHNIELVELLRQMACQANTTPTQLALAWARQKIGRGIVLVGTTSPLRLRENIASLSVNLSSGDVDALDHVFHRHAVCGARYADMSRVNG
jgi:aryl-alcohol dehydrogenase-like predicted oxidoreductase